ncbi:MAG TPA: FimV/HubP family polar landmark protein [Gammaproteobacteria bacterium]|jgi:FimV-like protein|nr:FimV/HubP family polar landmark protein [Gammaproteobacteria bacterium]
MTLTNIIIKSYSSILIAIGSAALFFFMLGSYLIMRLSRSKFPDDVVEDTEEVQSAPPTSSTPKRPRRVSDKTILSETLSDVSAISGEDPIATQLDLAKAYIESDKGQLAKIILTAVIRSGNSAYKDEAQRLLSSI